MAKGASCGWGAASQGDDNSCATGLICLNHVCQTTNSNDPTNCGSPGKVCPLIPGATQPTCKDGVCGISGCTPGFTMSNGKCVSTDDDEANCGKVGTVCAAPTANGVALCSAG